VGDIGQIAGVYNNIGNLEKDLQSAIFFLKKALSIFTKIGYSMGITESAHNLANSYLALGACNKAFLEYTKAFQLAKKMSYKFAISINLTGIGKVYKLWGDYKVAYNYLDRALRLATEINDKEGILENTYMIALLKCEKNESDALRWLENAEILAQEMSDQFFLTEILYEKIRYLTYLKNYTKISQFEKIVRKLSIKDFRLRAQSFWLLIEWELQNYYNKMGNKKQLQILVNKLERFFEQTQDREMIFYLGRTLVEFFLIHNLKKAGAIYSILNRLIKEEMRCYYSEVVFLGAKLNYYRGKDWQDRIRQALKIARQIGKKKLVLEMQEWLKSKRLKID
jgi:tetratricopeptide (TPR) repeat protein